MTLHDPAEESLFPALPEEVLESLPQYGEVIELADGEAAFREGESDYPFFAVLEGTLKIVKRFGQEERTLAQHRRGHFAGEISMLTGGPAIASGIAAGPVKLVRIPNAGFRKFAAEGSPMARLVLTAMAGRSRDVEAQARQQEKLASLGKLAAGLAHELNNPAAAARRTAGLLRETVTGLRKDALDHDERLDAAARGIACAFYEDLERHPRTLDPLARSDREQEIGEWLEARGCAEAGDHAVTLAAAGLTVAELDALAAQLAPEALHAVVSWLEATIRVHELAAELESATGRISELVLAMKDYSYMDRADFVEADIHQGLETTLKIFAPRFKSGVKVERRYDPRTPKICAYASELNQVWTNLIDNAIDAMKGKGTLTIATRGEGDGVTVEIGDTGAGIPAGIQSRIFDPFFTTKGVGQGTGLGLDISWRIVTRRHRGTITVQSRPGDTRFMVRLPLRPPKESDS